MDPPIPTTAIDEDDDWELCNEDGFVYKQSRILGSEDTSGAGEASKPPDPELEERNRRMRRKRILVKLKRKYQREIEQWEILSNSLNAMHEKSGRFQTPQRGESSNANETTSFPKSRGREHCGEAASATASSMLDELLSMAEAQEVIINDVSNLCEVAENICGMEEEEKKQSLFDLAVWSSPTGLMASLCTD
ncbi:hypothetical protein EUTSA_v10004961mg [Eutrema salsugineum]|uniref:Uncharacterized protein n=1 Tax=Eutrema salsugineum TaxID=72664 RepID=V4MMG7_EUTSA|nr:uncharacterized protein LOC18012343 [Eutrema salsugineum]ESQ32711.1 hypothetical protein EUTSA_v10004961mg [Eutrema salsugineum]